MNDPADREGAVFNAVRQLPQEKRGAYLEEACGGDVLLRQGVEELIQAHEQAGGFLETPAPEAGLLGDEGGPFGHDATTTSSDGSPSKPGDRIGRYKLLEQLGEGGCGVVYMAEQEEPVRRKVALKVIKLGMDTKSVIARFEVERQAMALMDHPNIAKVLDAGATEAGRPFFVMELVHGVRITHFCDQKNLSTRERLNLFVQVCLALQHAHQKGVIHRDVKPSNILVTLSDGAPVPKVIDFGIAKATEQRLTDKTLVTAMEQLIGTPAYMSPEQAEMNPAGVDTRSDIYALGVLLYELLTGETPFDSKILRKAGLDEIRRVIREQEPARPSTRLSAMVSEDLTRAARKRLTDPVRLIHLVRGDLDWIVMKALEKDRARRYQTANGLASDVQRFLNDEPISARPPSQLYLARKLIRRNQLFVSAASAVATAVIAGLGISTWLYFKEKAALQRASTAEAKQSQLRQQAEAASEETKATLEESDFSQAVRLAAQDDAADAMAYLGRVLSRNPTNDAALTRLATLLAYHSWMVPSLVLSNGDGVSSVKFSPDGRLLATASWNRTARVWDSRNGAMVTGALPHSGPLESPESVNFSPDGKWVVTASADNSVRVWNALNGQPRTQPLKHAAPVRSARFSADGRWILTAAQDGAARVWDAQSGQLVAGPMKHAGWVNSAQFSSDDERIVTASSDNNARVWRARDGELLATLVGHFGWVQSAGFTPDGKLVVTASDDGTARIWDAQTGQPIFPPCEHGDRICSLQLSPDGASFVTGSFDNTARVWDLHTGLPRTGPMRHGKPVVCAQFSPDGRRIVTASWDGTAQVWDAQSGLPLVEPMKHPTALTWAQFSPDGRRVAAACYDGTVLVWDQQNYQAIAQALPHKSKIWWAQFSPDGKLIAVALHDDTVRLWGSQTGQPAGEPLKHGAAVRFARFSPDGKLLVTASQDNTAQVWDVPTGKPVAAALRHDGTVRRAWFSPDSTQVVTVSEDRTARVWNARTGQAVTGRLKHPAWVGWAQFSPDGDRVVTACEDGTGRVWQARSGQLLAECPAQNGWVNSTEFSPDGKRVVMASQGGFALVWDAQSGKTLVGPLKHGNLVLTSQFSPDGKSVLTASADETARVWDALTGQLLVPPLHHEGALKSAQFSPDGKRIVTASLDHTARVWDVHSGRPLSDPFLHNGEVWGAQFSPDGRRFLTFSEDQAARIWYVAPTARRCPDWLLTLAEAISGKVLKKTGVLGETELDRFEALSRIRQTLESSAEGDEWAAWGRWFLDDSATRAISPLSTSRVQDYAQQQAQQNPASAPEETGRSRGARVDGNTRRALAENRLDRPNHRNERQSDNASRESGPANLLINGSFELGGFARSMRVSPAASLTGGDLMALMPGASELMGWQVVGPAGTDVGWYGPQNNDGLGAAEGSFSLDLTGVHDSAPFGGISQTIPTTAGQVYTVSFQLATDAALNGSVLPCVAVEITGISKAIYTVGTTGSQRWQTFSSTFTATTNRTALTFTGANTNNLRYIGLDNVVVTRAADAASTSGKPILNSLSRNHH